MVAIDLAAVVPHDGNLVGEVGVGDVAGRKCPQPDLSTKADIERTGLRIQRDTGKKRR
jgi:hypothetical protein